MPEGHPALKFQKYINNHRKRAPEGIIALQKALDIMKGNSSVSELLYNLLSSYNSINIHRDQFMMTLG